MRQLVQGFWPVTAPLRFQTPQPNSHFSSHLTEPIAGPKTVTGLLRDAFETKRALIDKTLAHLPQRFPRKVSTVFSDIDGTITYFDRQSRQLKIPEPTRQALQQLQKQGLLLCLSTGRTYFEARETAHRAGLDLKRTYFIAQNGTEIRDPQGKLLLEEKMSPQKAGAVLSQLDLLYQNAGHPPKVVAYLDGVPTMPVQFRSEKGFDRLVEPFDFKENFLPVAMVKEFFTPFGSPKKELTPTKLLLCDPNRDRLLQVRDNLTKVFPDLSVKVGHSNFCEIFPKTASKGLAVNWLAQHLKRPLQNAAAIGDGENDQEMLELLNQQGGLSIAMGNAPETVKGVAQFITGPVRGEQGFADAMHAILSNNQRHQA